MSALPSPPRPIALPTPLDAWIERIGLAAVLLLPPMLLHGRGIADILISTLDLLFLLRCARAGDWDWLRQPWVAVAGVFWLWLVGCTVFQDGARPIGQAVVSIRLLVLVAACQTWVLAAPRAQRWLAWVFAACAAWIALECWQQFLLGANLEGDRRAADGIITGPFRKERAGQIYLDVVFPGVLPFVLRRLERAAIAERLVGVAVLAVAAATMVLIGQRMPMLLLLLGLGAAGVLVRRLRVPVAAVLTACVLMVALLPLFSPPTFQRLVLHFAEQMRHFWVSDYGQIYLRALVMIGENPWFGLGYDGFRNHCLDPAYLHGLAGLGVGDAQVLADAGCNIHPHNHELELATSAGLPAMLLFVTLAVLWLRRIARRLHDGDVALRIALLVAFVVEFWPIAARSSLFVVDAGGWAFLIAGWGLATVSDPKQR